MPGIAALPASITCQEPLEAAHSYAYKSTIGEGAYGTVWRCTETATGADVAVKGFKQAHEEPEIMRMALREVRVLRGLDHPGVVRLLEAFRSKTGRVYMVFPYVGPSAYHAICINRQGLPPAQLRLMTWQLLQALAHLHGRRVVHRDIKPANILLGEGGIVKLCDFGFARSTKCGPRNADKLSSYVCTRWYRAPELLVGCEYGPAADVWSLGCTLAELATGAPLFQGCSSADQLWRIMRCFGPLAPQQARAMLSDSRLMAEGLCVPPRGRTLRERLGPRVDPSLASLLEDCLQVDPRSRPTAAELLQAPYFWTVPGLLAFTPAVRMAYRLHEAQEQAQQGPHEAQERAQLGRAQATSEAATAAPNPPQVAASPQPAAAGPLPAAAGPSPKTIPPASSKSTTPLGALQLSKKIPSLVPKAASEPTAQGLFGTTASGARTAAASIVAVDVTTLGLDCCLSDEPAAFVTAEVHAGSDANNSKQGSREGAPPRQTGGLPSASPGAMLRRSVPPESVRESVATAAQEPPAAAAPAAAPPAEAPAFVVAEPPPLLGAETAAEAALTTAAVPAHTSTPAATPAAPGPVFAEPDSDSSTPRALSLRQACVVLTAAVERDSSAARAGLRRSQTPTPGQLAALAAAPGGGRSAKRPFGSLTSLLAAQHPPAASLSAHPSSIQTPPSAGTSGGGPLGVFSGSLGLPDSTNLTHLRGTASAANARLQAGPLAPRLGRDHHSGGEEGAFGYTPGPSSHVVCLAQLATGEAQGGSPAASRVAAMCGLALAPAAGGTPTPPLSPGGALGLGGDGRLPASQQHVGPSAQAGAALVVWPQQQESRGKDRRPDGFITPGRTDACCLKATSAAVASTAARRYDGGGRGTVAPATGSGGTGGPIRSTAATLPARGFAGLTPAATGLAAFESGSWQHSKPLKPWRRRAQSFTFGGRLVSEAADRWDGRGSERCATDEGPAASAGCTAGILAAASLNDASLRSAAGTAARSAPDLLRWRPSQGRRQGGRTAAVSRPRSRLSLVPGPGAGTSPCIGAVAVAGADSDASPASGGQTQGATRPALADLFGAPRGGIIPLSTIRSSSLRWGRPSFEVAAAGKTGTAQIVAPADAIPAMLKQPGAPAPLSTAPAAAADRRGLFGRRRGLLCSKECPADADRGAGASARGEREGATGKASSAPGAARSNAVPRLPRGAAAGGLAGLLGRLAACVSGGTRRE